MAKGSARTILTENVIERELLILPPPRNISLLEASRFVTVATPNSNLTSRQARRRDTTKADSIFSGSRYA